MTTKEMQTLSFDNGATTYQLIDATAIHSEDISSQYDPVGEEPVNGLAIADALSTLTIPEVTDDVVSGGTDALSSGGAYTNLVRRLSSYAVTGGVNQGVYVDADGQVQSCNATTSAYSPSGITAVNGTAVASALSPIQELIPQDASSQNQLADKAFVNSSITTNTATFRGTFSSVQELEDYSGPKTNNDYAFVTSVDSAGNTIYNRYKYNGTSWVFEYALNNSSFTATQWAAINSGVDSTVVSKANSALQPNTTITGGTHTKITYDSNGLVTGGSDLLYSDITAALGFTPYDNSNPSNFITASDIGNGTITFTQGGVNKGSITTNQSGDTTIALDAGSGVNVDSALSTTSENPVQNKVITLALESLTASDVGALPSSTTINDLTTTTQQNALDSGANTTNIGQIATNTSNINSIQALIPQDATAQNQLADKAFVNSSVSTNTANFIGTFSSVQDLENYSGTLTNNDYAFVETTDSSGNSFYDRYKYTTATNPAGWQFEYELNNSSFTAIQWAAINSGVDTTVVSKANSALQSTDVVSTYSSSGTDPVNGQAIANAISGMSFAPLSIATTQNIEEVDSGTINLSQNTSIYHHTVSGNTTFTFNLSLTGTVAYTFELYLTMNTAYSLIFNNTTWQDNSSPDLSRTGTYFFAFRTINGGTSWLGNLQGVW